MNKNYMNLSLYDSIFPRNFANGLIFNKYIVW